MRLSIATGWQDRHGNDRGTVILLEPESPAEVADLHRLYESARRERAYADDGPTCGSLVLGLRA